MRREYPQVLLASTPANDAALGLGMAGVADGTEQRAGGERPQEASNTWGKRNVESASCSIAGLFIYRWAATQEEA